MKGKRILPASIAVFLLSIGLMWILVWNRQDIDVAINREDTHHIVANTGRGAQRLNNAEHQEMLDRIAAMVNGTYRYKKTWSNAGRSGGGPYYIRFVNESNTVVYEFQYVNGCLAIPANRKGRYYLYERKGEPLSLDEFEAYLRAYGEFDK